MKKGSLLVLGVVVGLLLGMAFSVGAANILPPARSIDGVTPGACYVLVEQALNEEVSSELIGYLTVMQDGELDATMGHVVRMTELIQALHEAPVICSPAPRVSR